MESWRSCDYKSEYIPHFDPNLPTHTEFSHVVIELIPKSETPWPVWKLAAAGWYRYGW